MTSELSVVRHVHLSVVKGEGRKPKRGSRVYLDSHKLFDRVSWSMELLLESKIGIFFISLIKGEP